MSDPTAEMDFSEGYREAFFARLKKDTRYFNQDDYSIVYTPVKEHFGINSPACIIAKQHFPQHPFPESLPPDIGGEYLIAINIDSVPDKDFLKYLSQHEYWEIYIAEKEGSSLRDHCLADSCRPVLEKERLAHQFATLKEFEEAEKDEKSDQYMKWWRSFYDSSIQEVENLPDGKIRRISKNYGLNGDPREMIIQFLKNGLEIKAKAFQKVISRRKRLRG